MFKFRETVTVIEQYDAIVLFNSESGDIYRISQEDYQAMRRVETPDGHLLCVVNKLRDLRLLEP